MSQDESESGRDVFAAGLELRQDAQHAHAGAAHGTGEAEPAPGAREGTDVLKQMGLE